MRIFVTGGTGFIGSHFLKLAIDQGYEVVALRRPGSTPRIQLQKEPIWIDGTLEDDLRAGFSGCNTLVHLASHGVDLQATWEDCFRWNVVASIVTWHAAVEAGVRRLIIAGSCFEYGQSAENYDFIPCSAPLLPTASYHSSKAAATMAAIGLAIDKQVQVAVLRPFHTYGEGEAAHRFWPALRNAALAGENFPMTSGTQLRDFTHVSDMAAKFVEAVKRTDLQPGKPVIENLGSGHPCTLYEFARSEWERLGATGQLIPNMIPMRKNEVMRYVPEL